MKRVIVLQLLQTTSLGLFEVREQNGGQVVV